MTGAELKTMREAIGLSQQWLANAAGVSLRTLAYWESGKIRVPDDVADLVNTMTDNIDNAVLSGVQAINASEKRPDQIVLLRYRSDDDLWRFRQDMQGLPTTYHAALIGQLRKAIIGIGIPCWIRWMEPEQYMSWLGDRPDSEAMRAAWAASA